MTEETTDSTNNKSKQEWEKLDPSLPIGWVLTDLPDVPRECFGTYGYYRMSEIPFRLDSGNREDFPFLDAIEVSDPNAANAVNKLVEKAKSAFNVDVSTFFIKFMSSPQAQDMIRSNTACYFSLDKDVHALPDNKGFCIRFLNDQQGCCYWYLHLRLDPVTNKTVESVLWNVELLGDETEDEDEEENGAISAFMQQRLKCANSFEEFIRRFYLENELWFILSDGEDLENKAVKQYLRDSQVILNRNYKVLITLLSVRAVPRLGRNSLAKVLPIDLLRRVAVCLPL